MGEWEALSSVAFGAGVVGLVGSITGHITGMLEVGPSWWWANSWWLFVFGFFVANLGLLFLGNSVVQSGAPPRWKGLPLLIGSLGILLILVSDTPNSPFGVYPSLALWMLFGLAWVALSLALWSAESETAEQPVPTR